MGKKWARTVHADSHAHGMFGLSAVMLLLAVWLCVCSQHDAGSNSSQRAAERCVGHQPARSAIAIASQVYARKINCMSGKYKIAKDSLTQLVSHLIHIYMVHITSEKFIMCD